MKKVGAFAIIFLLLFSLAPLAIAAENETDTNETDDDPDTNSTITSSTTSDDLSDKEKINEGFDCLEEKVNDCSALSTTELALTILATPDDETFDDCVDELQDREASDHWGNIKDTALAILALQHAGIETTEAEEWLLDQEKTPTDLIWYLEQDSNEETTCHLKYDSNDYTITVAENKKIDKDAGSCLTRAQSNFWLKVAPQCYEKDLVIECDKDFIATLLYKDKDSPTIYVLEGTDSSPAFGSITLNVKTKCFGESGCDYESTAWATVALLETGYDIENYIPYVIAMADTNQRYLPEAFIYMVTNYEDYATQLIESQKLGNYWEADSTAYNRFYDTALALIAIGSSSSEKVTKAKDWLLFSQGSSGCWQNSIRDTAIVLWALAGRSGKSGSSGSGVTYCSEANYFCIPSSDCPTTEDVGDNYFCASLSDTCCKTENLQSCSAYGGEICESGKVCTGNEKRATDTNKCCTGECVERQEENECEANFYTCMDSCSDFQEEVSTYACDSGEVCCKAKTSQEGGSSWWIWILVILIIIVLAAIAYIKRDALSLFWFRLKTRFKKDKGSKGGPSSTGPSHPSAPGYPSRPGFPPIRRMPMRQPPRPAQNRSYDRRDSEMQDTFRKLQEMSK